jgi:23S rRNA (uracil1939-C5)-methyltransferase
LDATDGFELTIDKLVFGGSGLGRHQGKVVFVPFSAPGDLLIVRPVEEKKQLTRAEIIKIIRPGPGRTSPACPHFMKCGGCQWQHLDYPHQVEAKRKILEETFHHRFPQTRDLSIAITACPQNFGYRSRARIQLRRQGDGTAIGFFRCESHTVEDVENCPLLRPLLNKALSAVRRRSIGDAGWKQEMDIACSEEEGIWAADSAQILHRKIGEFRYSFTAPVFFQANDFIVPELVSLVRTLCKDAGISSALDLFAGVGLFTLPLALQFKRVVTVEGSEAACRLCLKNLSQAKLRKVEVVCSDVLQWMKSTESMEGLDLLLLDPPRTGAGNAVMDQILRWSPQTIIYVSCDPQTLCRDLDRIAAFYKIDWIEGLDMFPQTYHFETVVRLIKQ